MGTELAEVVGLFPFLPPSSSFPYSFTLFSWDHIHDILTHVQFCLFLRDANQVAIGLLPRSQLELDFRICSLTS